MNNCFLILLESTMSCCGVEENKTSLILSISMIVKPAVSVSLRNYSQIDFYYLFLRKMAYSFSPSFNSSSSPASFSSFSATISFSLSISLKSSSFNINLFSSMTASLSPFFLGGYTNSSVAFTFRLSYIFFSLLMRKSWLDLRYLCNPLR